MVASYRPWKPRYWCRRSFILLNCLMLLVTATLVWKSKTPRELAVYSAAESPRSVPHTVGEQGRDSQQQRSGPEQAAADQVLPNNTRSLNTSASPTERREEPTVVKQANSSTLDEDGLLRGYVAVSNISKHLEYKCGRCAIISNSGQILRRNASKDVDANDCVIRMNDAPVLGFEQDVGTKTDIRIISFASIGLFKPADLFVGVGAAKTVIFWGPKDLMAVDGKGRVFNTITEYQGNYSDVQFYMFTNEKMDEAHALYEKETRLKIGPIWASTGWFTMQFAREVCDSITIYGMSHPDFCKTHSLDKAPYHYYAPGGQKECNRYLVHERQRKNVHRYRSERDVFLRWAKSKDVDLQFKHPSW